MRFWILWSCTSLPFCSLRQMLLFWISIWKFFWRALPLHQAWQWQRCASPVSENWRAVGWIHRRRHQERLCSGALLTNRSSRWCTTTCWIRWFPCSSQFISFLTSTAMTRSRIRRSTKSPTFSLRLWGKIPILLRRTAIERWTVDGSLMCS